MIPAALLTVAVIAAAIVITSQQQQNSNRPQVTLPTGTQTPRTHIRSSSHAAVHRPFPRGVAVDSAGNLYVTDSANNRVVTLAAGSNTQSVLPFDGLNGPTCSRYGRGGYRYFTIAMLRDIAAYCYRQHWYSFDELKSTFRELAIAAYGDTGEYKIPS